MLELVISGGQTGADLAGWRAAKRCSIPTGGFMPRHFKTEQGFRPGYATLYGAKEHESGEYPPRTAANVRDSDVTLWLGRGDSSGYFCTLKAANRHLRAFWEIGSEANNEPAELIAKRIMLLGIKSVNVAGNRESKSPGIGVWAEAYLVEVFVLLGHKDSQERMT